MDSQPTDPRRSQMLDVLDHEIARLTNDAQWAGLSVWAIQGSIAGIIWLASEELKSSSLSWQPLKIGFLWFVCSIFVDSLYWLALLVEDPAPVQHYWQPPRVLPANRFVERITSRVGSVVSMCRSAIFLFLLTKVRTAFGWILSVVLGFVYLSHIVILGLALAISFTTLPFLLYNAAPPKRWLNALFRILSGISVVTVCIAVIWKSRSIIAMATWTELRVGVLACVVTWLFQMMFSRNSSKPRIDQLQDARRDVGLGLVQPEAVVSILERTLAGEDTERVLDALVGPALASLDTIVDDDRAIERDALTLKAKVEAVSGPLDGDILRQLTDVVLRSSSNAGRKEAEVKKALVVVQEARRGLRRLAAGPAKEMSLTRQRELDERIQTLLTGAHAHASAIGDLIKSANAKGFEKDAIDERQRQMPPIELE